MINSVFSIYCIISLCFISAESKIAYTFPEFPYKDISKNEVVYNEYEAACGEACKTRDGISKILCVRQCMSPTCYKDLYGYDMLEEGEVDVRLNSFKGCFIQRHHKSRP